MTEPIEKVNSRIDEIIGIINAKIIEKKESGNYIPWDIENECNPDTYIKKGYICLKDNVCFNTIVDAVSCFGKKYITIQKGGVKHPIEKDILIWFPKLYVNDKWENSISDDELIITEKNQEMDFRKKHIDKILSKPNNNPHKRIVFARVKGTLGDIMYRFKGLYELNLNHTNYNNGLIWKRISEEVKTYSPDRR